MHLIHTKKSFFSRNFSRNLYDELTFNYDHKRALITTIIAVNC